VRVVFQQELHEVQDRLVRIAELVEVAIRDATVAFRSSDVALAESVIDKDSDIDALADGLDELAIAILARQAPVARDLRLIVSALRMSASLERMGDIAEHIAQLARYRFPDKVIPKGLRKTFDEMGDIDVEMAGLLTQLLREQDTALVTKIRDLDDRLDELHASVFEKVLSESFTADRMNVIDATLASRYHERFGDHAVSITKKVLYFISGDFSEAAHSTDTDD
jgi:phosphate transport system protein